MSKKKAKKKKTKGTNGKYHEWLTEEGLIKLEGFARDGLTNDQIAHNIGINPDTLYTWKKKYAEISEALKRGKEVIDRQVENALLKRALGYEYKENEYLVSTMDEEEYLFELDRFMKIYKYENPNATDAELEYKKLTFPREKHVLVKSKTKESVPDTTAQIFWLKNRKPNDWRDKKETELSGGVNLNNPFSELTTEELRKALNSLDDG